MASHTNQGYRYAERIGASADGANVLAYLAGRYRHSSAPRWREHIQEGRVRLDGRRVDASDALRRGATLTFERPPWVEPVAPTSFAVLYRDDDVLAVAKPAGLAAMPGGGFLDRTLLRRVGRYAPEASPLHRLGRGTSGITLFARHRDAKRALTSAWSSGAVVRRYRTLVTGVVPWDEETIDAPIGKVPHARLGSVWAASPEGKPSKTTVRVLERRSETTLCEIDIETGRPHQIRIHLAAAGHPLAGDALYPPGGVPEPSARALPGDVGYRLHAHELWFPSPSSGRTIAVHCQPPPDLMEHP